MGAYVGCSIVARHRLLLGRLSCRAVRGGGACGVVLYLRLVRRMRQRRPDEPGAGDFRPDLHSFGSRPHCLGRYCARLSEPPVLSPARPSFSASTIPTYRLFIIALGLILMTGLSLRLDAHADRRHDPRRRRQRPHGRLPRHQCRAAFLPVFCLGCALAGLAGVVAAPVLSATPEYGHRHPDPDADRRGDRRARQPQRRDHRLAARRLHPDFWRGDCAAARLDPGLRAAGRRADPPPGGPVPGPELADVPPDADQDAARSVIVLAGLGATRSSAAISRASS